MGHVPPRPDLTPRELEALVARALAANPDRGLSYYEGAMGGIQGERDDATRALTRPGSGYGQVGGWGRYQAAEKALGDNKDLVAAFQGWEANRVTESIASIKRDTESTKERTSYNAAMKDRHDKSAQRQSRNTTINMGANGLRIPSGTGS